MPCTKRSNPIWRITPSSTWNSASEKWNLSIGEAADIFTKYKVFEYIRDCFGIFHVEGDEAVWEDLIPYLRNRGCHYA